jgi:hypothetical protein
MIRGAGAVLVGLIAWAVIATALNVLLRIALPGYAASEPQFKFTLCMMVARLALPGAIPSVCAGFLSAWIAHSDRRVIVALILIFLAIFLPAHYRLWEKFPLWYHLTFLGSLILLPVLGARLKSLILKR